MMQSNTIHESDGNVVRTVKSFTDLPPEMVTAILIHVRTSDLINFRQVNRQWNAIATEIIRNRADITLHFKLISMNFVQRIPHRHPEKLLLIEPNRTLSPVSRNLHDLVACIQNSKHLQQFPYTAFQFDAITHIRGQDIQNFLKTFGEKIRSLKLGLRDVKCGEIMQNILESTPNLKKLEINDFWIHAGFPSIIGICVKPHQKLHNLEVLSVDQFCRIYPKIIEDIITMSPNLKRVSFGDLDITANDLQMLESTKKLDCLKTVKIRITKDIIALWKKSLKCFDFQMESMDLSVFESVIVHPQLKLDVIEIVSQLIYSSKDVMRTLCIDKLRLLSELQLPKLEKVQTLHLREDDFQIFPPLLNWLTSFPNIKELDIDLFRTPFGSLKSQQIRLPSVELVRIRCTEKCDIPILIEMTPNAQTLLIVDETSFWDERILVSFDEISTHVPKLVNFGWKMRRPNNNSQHKLDAVLTGLPENLCKQLAEKFRNKDDGLSADEIAAYQRERIRLSILDFKDLKHLELDFVCFDNDYSDDQESCYDELNGRSDAIGYDPDGHFYKTGITKVSKLLGFDLIPGLKVLINRDFQ